LSQNDDEDESMETSGTQLKLRGFGIEVDFSELEDEERDDGNPEHGQEMEERIAHLAAEIEKMAPNLKSKQK
jgi:structural maintenance of chromosome 1